MATVTQLTTDQISGNQFISQTQFEDWADNYTGTDPAVYVMSDSLLDDLESDFLGNSDAVAISFYFGITGQGNKRVLLLTGTRDSGEDVFNSNQIYYLNSPRILGVLG